MKLWRRRSLSFAIASLKEKTSLFISCFLIAVVTQPTQAKEVTEIPSVQELNRSARTVKEWFAQIEQQNPPAQSQEGEVIQVTSVKANPTSKGVEVILQTSKGEQLQVVNRSSGNNFIADIPNAQLRLPNGDAFTFRSTSPIAGVSEITVTNFDANTIRMSVTGEAGVPIVELFDSPDEGIIFSVASAAPDTQPQQQPQTPPTQPETQTQPSQPSTQGDEPIELVVTGEQDGYNVPEASTATRTDTPLRDIPQSIEVIPQQVIKDQGITRIVDATRNVSGVAAVSGYGNTFGDVNIRGFYGGTLVDGFTGLLPANGANIEQVEVLKGPASVLYGQLEPGGLVNYVTKKPLNTPYYSASFTAGSFDYYNPAIDLSGPLTTDKRLLYRLNVSYENSASYRDYLGNNIFYISPVFTYKIDDETTLDFAYEYLNSQQGFDRGLKPEAIFLTLPRNRLLSQPDDFFNTESHRVALTLNQQFSENWQMKSRFSAQFDENSEKVTQIGGDLLEDGRTLTRGQFGDGPNYRQILALQSNLIGKFNTGAIAHQLLLGVDWNRNTFDYNNSYDIDFPSIDIFEPNYDVPLPERIYGKGNTTSNTTGIYLQDQVTLLSNLKLLVGGRYDFIDSRSENFNASVFSSESSKSGYYYEAFSPRVGIVYQPIEPISLYASYSRSFNADGGRDRNNQLLEPSRGTQYEVGIKAELFDKRLSATLAAYDIAKTNVPTVDPIDDQYSIALGEVKSRGIELDVAGEILPGWKVIASGFLNDAYVSKDNDPTVQGKHLENAPYHGASLWTSYEFQKGNLQGLQFGAGLFFTGDRVANQSEQFILPSYVRTDALISYKRDNWQVGLNFKNIFDVKYYESNGYLTFPQAPFTVQGTISVTF
ncbi:MAG: TonB-dependent siderophore receptor [Aulosira sp. DedQUE10]|nr:TonB-dependent siderophore receptor [Aulosira sp. DedQUE10]